MKISREIKIGLLVASAFLILLWGFNFLKGRNVFFSGNMYYGLYNRVDGLTDASPIYYKGFKIGSVRDIDIYDNDKVIFIVTFDINKNVKFPANTLAQIYSLDLMGSKGIQFIEGDSPHYLAPGDTLQSSVMGDFVDQMSMQVLPLKEKTEKLIVKLDSSLTKLSGFFNESNKRHFSNAMASIDVTMANLVTASAEFKHQLGEDGNIHNVIIKLDSFSSTLESKKEEIGQMIDNFSEFSENIKKAELGQSLVALNSTLSQADSIMTSINNGEGSAGMLLHDKELYYRLTDASSNLDRLLLDVRHNPKRYMSFSAINFGKKVYVQDNGLGNQGLVFMIKIKESKKPLDIAGKEIENGMRIYEDYDDSKYIYSVGQMNSYKEAKDLLVEVKKYYPDANIIAVENGVPIRIGKAIKKASL